MNEKINKTFSNRVFEILGLNKPCHKLSDFEVNLQIHYILGFAIDMGLFIFGIFFAISTKMIPAIVIFFSVTILAAAYHIYGFLQLLGGQVYYLEGECTLVEKNVFSAFKKTVFGTSKIEVVSDDHTYVVPVSHRSKYKEGSMVRIYFTDGNIYKKDDDTSDIPYPVFVTKIKNSRH